jgi:ABC-2 type transport system permease protein
MIYCLLFVGTIVILEAWPVYLIFMAKLGQRAISPGQWAGVGLSFATILILNTLAVFVPMRIGLARLSEYEV